MIEDPDGLLKSFRPCRGFRGLTVHVEACHADGHGWHDQGSQMRRGRHAETGDRQWARWMLCFLMLTSC